MPLNYNPGDAEANWLPAHAGRPFSLTARIYWPADAVLDGTASFRR